MTSLLHLMAINDLIFSDMLLTIVLDLFFGLEMPTWQIEANLNAAYAQDMNQSFIELERYESI